ncbi:response regulator [Mucilaginibacter aquaedulcis]|uniref:response regulator n=1 Tax=Mucilaginibacter aquaedulcis TaxID=1187081 RepID=UPI0025B54929|nr:response regulator [Mucilaginibacter aquaedulcis]MDN3550187.1 response regulator [Mucilaginibacter aquaedulcis]
MIKVVLITTNKKIQKILLIDNEVAIVKIVNYILSDEGYQVNELVDGYNVNSAIAESSPDVILLDVTLGDVNESYM